MRRWPRGAPQGLQLGGLSGGEKKVTFCKVGILVLGCYRRGNRDM